MVGREGGREEGREKEAGYLVGLGGLRHEAPTVEVDEQAGRWRVALGLQSQ